MTDRAQQLLSILSDGNYHSGQALGASLGISRAAVWKLIQQLQAQHVAVQSRHGQGYSWCAPAQLLSQDALVDLLKHPQPMMPEVYWQLPSTNNFLLEAARTDCIHGRAVFAEQQTHGRGRRGRTWVSPLAQNLYCSIGWQFDSGIAQIEGLSLAVGVVIVRHLQSLGITGLALKWPNDIWLDGRKLAGVLIEVGGDLSGQFHLVLGIGLNSHMPVAEAVSQGWASLLEQVNFNRNALAAGLLDELTQLLSTFARDGFVHYREEWNRLNALQNRSILIDQAGSCELATCLDVAANGGLRVLGQGGIKTLLGGEVSLRIPAETAHG